MRWVDSAYATAYRETDMDMWRRGGGGEADREAREDKEGEERGTSGTSGAKGGVRVGVWYGELSTI